MKIRRLILGATVAMGAVALFAFAFGSGPGRSSDAEAAGITRPVCTFSTPLRDAQVGASNTATCTFGIHEVSHTLVVEFVVSAPPSITSCTLDGVAIHVGPCP